MTSESNTEHRLDGLEPDNLLAFLALLGLLRALETARPDWRPRVRWSLEQPPLRPVLVLRQPLDQASVSAAAAEGVAMLAAAHDFDRKLLNFTYLEARHFLETNRCDPKRSELWSALISDAAFDETKCLVRKTPLNFLDVAQVAFLKTLGVICSSAEMPKRGLAKCIEDASFRNWTRRDKTLSFRWDPLEDSRHAYRANAPTDDKQRVEHGANVLGSLGLRTFVVVPAATPSSVVLLKTRGVRTQTGVTFWWPIWRLALSLSTIEALLEQAELSEAQRERWSVETVTSASRLAPPGSKYRNVSWARDARSATVRQRVEAEVEGLSRAAETDAVDWIE